MRIIKTKNSAIAHGNDAVLSVTCGSSTVMVIAPSGVSVAVPAHPLSLGTIYSRLLDRIGTKANIDLDELAGEVEKLRLIRLHETQVAWLRIAAAEGEVLMPLEVGSVLSSNQLVYQHGYLGGDSETFAIKADGLAWLVMNPETPQA